ncbi:MAG: hypothetical protein AB7O43_14125 [Hyphomicrobiaceae bacterium]
MRDSANTILLACVLSGALAGCGLSTSSLSTGSLFGPGKPPTTAATQAAAPPPATPQDRARFVSATVARAKRCGFYLDPEAVKASYLAAEAQSGIQPAEVEHLTKIYNGTYSGTAKSGGPVAGECPEAENMRIKTDLGRVLAGDYTPPPKKPDASDNLWDSLTASNRPEKFNPQDVFDRSEGVIKGREMGD